MDGIYLTCTEQDSLFGVSGTAMKIYLWLRSWVDVRSGVVGVTQALSLGKLEAYSETHIRRGKGWQIQRPSRQTVRSALGELGRVGLLARVKSEVLVFRLPKMKTASVAPSHAQNKPNTMAAGFSTGRDKSRMPDAARGLGGFERGAGEGSGSAKPTHIRDQGKPSTPQAASTESSGVDATKSFAAAAGVDGQRLKTLSTLVRQCCGDRAADAPVIRQWVTEGVTEAELREAVAVAVSRRLQEGSQQPVNPGFLHAILRDTRQRAPAQCGLATGWWRSHAAMTAKARELGIADARPGESAEDFRARIAVALERAAVVDSAAVPS